MTRASRPAHAARRRPRTPLVAGLTAALTAAGLLLGPTATASADDDDAELQRRILDPRITESSGLARSGYDDGVLWTHNDSGDGPRLYAVDRNGGTAATIELAGVRALDWEAMSRVRGADGRSRLFVGDIGDNARARPEIAVHRIDEPRELDEDATVPATTYRMRYEDGPHDAEALLVHPRTARVYVVTKDAAGAAGVYAAPEDLRTDEVNVLERVADAPAVVTDGAFLWDGRLALRTYTSVHVSAWLGAPAQALTLPRTAQGESLAVAPGSRAVLVGSEGVASPVYRQPLPD